MMCNHICHSLDVLVRRPHPRPGTASLSRRVGVDAALRTSRAVVYTIRTADDGGKEQQRRARRELAHALHRRHRYLPVCAPGVTEEWKRGELPLHPHRHYVSGPRRAA